MGRPGGAVSSAIAQTDAELKEVGALIGNMPVGSALYRLSAEDWVLMLNPGDDEAEALKEIEGKGVSPRVVLRAALAVGDGRLVL